MYPIYFERWKNWFLGISSLKNTVTAIWREKSGSLLFRDKKWSSQLLGERKKIMTCI